MKKILLISALALACTGGSSIKAQNDNGTGTRIDYYDKYNDWIMSTYPNSSNSAFQLYPSSDGTWNVSDPGGTSLRIATMSFVPYGTQSYPLNVQVEETPGNEEMEVTYEVITEDESQRVVARAGEEAPDVKCGSMIRFHINAPEGMYPFVSIYNEYTKRDIQNELIPYTIHSFPFDNLYFILLTNYSKTAQGREHIINFFENEGDIRQVEGEPGHWTFDVRMGNEPMTFTFDLKRPDAEDLRVQVARALRSLYDQYQDYTFNAPFVTGEPYIMQAVGEYFGNDYVSDLARKVNYRYFYINTSNAFMLLLPWQICNSQISYANLILTYLDLYDGYVTEAEKANARAQMLTLRSHAYWRLLQVYGARWQDSDNGEAYCAPLDLTFTAENHPLAKMKDIFAQCYTDLDEAITILSGTSVEPYDILTPTADVARGVKMRLALLKEDWQTAQSLAQAIVNKYPVSSAEDMTAGFFSPTPSWIWGAPNEMKAYDSNMFFWALECQNACNGIYPSVWNYAPGAIDRDLYECIPDGDIRKTMFVTPDNFTGITWDDLYSVDYLNPQNMTVENPQIRNMLKQKTPEGVEDGAYTSDGHDIPVQICGQFKFFASTGLPYMGDDVVVFMRMEEALLTLAEAAYHNGDQTLAQESLVKLNNNRNPGYSCTATGQALLDEIRLQRKIELWGEGFSWFDDKRWNQPILRNSGALGNPDTGNWSLEMESIVYPDEYNGWRYVIPARAITNNPLIDISLMNYQDVEYPEPQNAPAKKVNVGNQSLPLKELLKTPAATMTTVQ